MSGTSDEPRPISSNQAQNGLLTEVLPQPPSPSPEVEPLIMGIEVPDAPLPAMYIKIEPHPHSLESKTRIIPLDGTASAMTSADSTPANIPHLTTRPWVPFRNHADFEYTETAVEGLLSKKLIDCQLAGISGSWSKNGSHLTLCSWADMERSLDAFIPGDVSASYQGVEYKFKFEYQDLWQWILSLVHDLSLADVSGFHSVRKSYCEGNFIERLFNEPNTGRAWEKIDNELPAPDPHLHCFLPLHIWLDKGLVMKHVKKHPMVLQAAWLLGNI
ncbi:hypothetical protein PILCRDRAFT_2888 [Piloderma croceum F 1598]|uniref:Uncharacterized protein n=1 Tax=Piloderma croceum (strain F 1598) TaxID=765440 RepID=A0A0C3GAD8_PILCF|nr:hypothetical protein PILCRDRAFT_2888 [Piloderma croceum F 1598]